MKLNLKKPISFRTEEAKIKKEIEIIHEAAERLGRILNSELSTIGRGFNINTGLAHATVEHVEYDASMLFEFIGYTLIDCDIQTEELENGVKNLIEAHFVQNEISERIAGSEQQQLFIEVVRRKIEGGSK